MYSQCTGFRYIHIFDHLNYELTFGYSLFSIYVRCHIKNLSIKDSFNCQCWPNFYCAKYTHTYFIFMTTKIFQVNFGVLIWSSVSHGETPNSCRKIQSIFRFTHCCRSELSDNKDFSHVKHYGYGKILKRSLKTYNSYFNGLNH